MRLSRMSSSSTFWMSRFIAGSSDISFTKRLFFGAPRFTCRSLNPASHSCLGSCRRLSASARIRFTSWPCVRTSRSTSGFISSYFWTLCSTGPEMMSGVRASSIRTESTSSMMA